MSTQVDSRNLGRFAEAAAARLDKSQWTDLQHIKYTIGLWDGVAGHPVQVRELPEWTWVPNDDYKKLRGILSGHPEHDTTEMKARERAWEEEHDARKFGRSSS
jgi:hypothetical protein